MISKLKYSLLLVIVFCIFSCSNDKVKQHKVNENDHTYFEIENKSNDTLFRSPSIHYDPDESFCYTNQIGDTIIPYGMFHMGFSDTIINYGIVIQEVNNDYEMIGINKKGQRLYEIHWFDNGPDLMSDNTFRIIRNNKIGYANEKGEIIIKAQFACAYPFENGLAKVSYECENFSKDPMPRAAESNAWFYINKKGETIKK